MSSSSGNDILYRMAHPSQRPQVMDLLYTSFFADEPMTSTLGITDGERRVDVLTEYAVACLEENLSIVALDSETGQLLGEQCGEETRG